MTKTPRPTDRQLQVLAAIDDHWTEHGFAPSLRELCEVLDLASTNGANDHVKSLQIAGYVTRQPRTIRTLRLTDEGERALRLARNGGDDGSD